MTHYLSYSFEDNESFINTFDEMPLWSAAFGLLLLKHLELSDNITVVDIGSGAGFPAIELAERLGNSCIVYGIDTWKNANERARLKIHNYGLKNIQIIEASAESIPFENDSVDLIVSNLGINNFENPDLVFKECYRILKPGGRLALTTNLQGHWREFYNIFYATLRELGKNDLIVSLEKEEHHRGNSQSISELFLQNEFIVTSLIEDSFTMKFNNGSAFLNHHFVKLGWLSSWMKLFPTDELPVIFSKLEENLNKVSANQNGLKFRVPMAYAEAFKK